MRKALSSPVQRAACAVPPQRLLCAPGVCNVVGRHGRQRVLVHAAKGAEDIFGKLKDRSYLDAAAKRYTLAIENDIDEDEFVSMELGPVAGSEVGKQYKDKIKEKLRKRAAELKQQEDELRAKLSKNFVLGKEAYECGEYSAAVRLLEVGVEDTGRDTQLGGEALLWLALAYQAVGREEDAIETLKSVEKDHPIRKLKKQAENMRYILEAPKLELTDEEHVQIPLIESYSWRKDGKYKSVSSRTAKPSKPKTTSYWDRVDWDMPAPSFVPNKWYYQVAWAVVLAVFVVYVNVYVAKG